MGSHPSRVVFKEKWFNSLDVPPQNMSMGKTDRKETQNLVISVIGGARLFQIRFIRDAVKSARFHSVQTAGGSVARDGLRLWLVQSRSSAPTP